MELVDPKYIIKTKSPVINLNPKQNTTSEGGNKGVIFMVCFFGFILFLYYIMKNVPPNELQVKFEDDTIPDQNQYQLSPYNQDSTDINFATFA